MGKEKETRKDAFPGKKEMMSWLQEEAVLHYVFKGRSGWKDNEYFSCQEYHKRPEV